MTEKNLVKALESIAANRCCSQCQEAALVAKAALDAYNMDEKFDRLTVEIMRYANLNPDQAGQYTPAKAFGFIHKNSFGGASARFIYDALALLDCYRDAYRKETRLSL